MSNLKIHFINGEVLKVISSCDVDFHEITGQYMSFDDFFLNLKNVLYIEKEVAAKEPKIAGKEAENEKEGDR